MDIFLPIAIVVVFFILFTICGWCCKRKQRGVVFGQGGTPIIVSDQPVNASPVVIAPYPLDPHHPVPQPMPGHAPPPGFTYQGTAYPGVYPPAGVPGQMPGYPPVPYVPPQSAPPPYHEAVMQPPPQTSQIANEGYMKQSPYNPNY